MVAPILLALAPLVKDLAKWGFSAISSVVATKGKEVVEEKFGIKLDDMLGSEEGRYKLKQLEIEHEQFLLEMAEKSEVRDLTYFQEEVKDRSSARESNATIAIAEAAPWYQKALLPMIAVLVTTGFFGCLSCLFYLSANKITLDDNSRDVLIFAFGNLTAGWMAIMNYLFGSSKGSTDKDAVLATMAKRGSQP